MQEVISIFILLILLSGIICLIELLHSGIMELGGSFLPECRISDMKVFRLQKQPKLS